MLEFRNFVQKLDVVGCKPSKGWFTWTNRRMGFSNIVERLDKFLISSYWLKEDIQVSTKTLPYSVSDHFPVQLEIGSKIQGGSDYFKFQNMWWRDASIRENMEKWWSQCNHMRGTPSFYFIKKIAYIKNQLRIWNREVFKNIFSEKERIEAELEALNLIFLVEGMNQDDYIHEKELISMLSEILTREEIYWKDKAREMWIKEGDKNTKFFHASVKARRAQNQINEIVSKDRVPHRDRDSIGLVAVAYFKKILNVDGLREEHYADKLLEAIPRLVSDEDNQMLMEPFTKVEV
ncbi:uncharacterized protein LOC131857650 [Cryptomeria japonica]|uniref:uncharacterized protein LOC131857650 n=1 Tax=Cryptomeria japonica TaxID=3369 RepID=UPI0027DA7EB7|nr:uncharacterized protein LOC131857650 [Cryptomeria japonica]